MSAKLTPWFPANTAPVRSGYYDTLRPSEAPVEIRLYWSTEHLRWQASPNSNFYGFMNIAQCRKWRGLAKEPK